MSISDAQIISNGRSNVVAMELQDNGLTLTDLSTIYQVDLILDGLVSVTLSSVTKPELFNWADNYVTIQVGLAEVPDGDYYGTLITYDPSNSTGIRWTNNLFLQLKSPCN